MEHSVLFVDDDVNLLSGLRRQYRGRFKLVTAVGGEEALEAVDAKGPFAVVVVDMRMPGMDGLVLLEKLQKKSPHTVRMMLTGNADQETAINAINTGRIFRFYNKPCPADVLAEGIDAALHQHDLEDTERTLLQKTLAGSVKVLIDVLSLVDHQRFGRATQVRDWCRVLAKEVTGISPWELELAALLKSIGAVSLPPDLSAKYEKGERLTEAEREMIARVPTVSRDLIANIPRLETVAQTVYCADRAFDGTEGYPTDKPIGEAIPAGSRLLRILFDVAHETSRQGSVKQAFATLIERHGKYDPVLLHRAHDVLGALEKDTGEEIVELPVKLLLPGQRLLSDLMTKKGWLVLAAGNVLSRVQVERLYNLTKMYEFHEPIRVVQIPREKKEKA